MRWGKPGAFRLTLVGKGVCFDTGGLDIKPAVGDALMKKDMGGAANVLALAMMIMDAGLPVDLRVLIPAVENSIAASAFRPGDVLSSRKGLTVQIDNTDAEGRLVLADALTYACEDDPDLLIDMATLTGAARVALGPICRRSTPTTRRWPARSRSLAKARSIRSGGCRCTSPTKPMSKPDRRPDQRAVRWLCRLDHRGPVPQALRLRRKPAGRISTSSPGRRRTSRMPRWAARHRRIRALFDVISKRHPA
jgi:hypothetical protein